MSAAIDRSETQELITDFRHGAPAKPPIVESGQHRTTVLTAKSLHRPVYLFQANKTRLTAHAHRFAPSSSFYGSIQSAWMSHRQLKPTENLNRCKFNV